MTATITLFPLLGRTPPPWRWPPDMLATSVGTHVAYVAAVRRRRRRSADLPCSRSRLGDEDGDLRGHRRGQAARGSAAHAGLGFRKPGLGHLRGPAPVATAPLRSQTVLTSPPETRIMPWKRRHRRQALARITQSER